MNKHNLHIPSEIRIYRQAYQWICVRKCFCNNLTTNAQTVSSHIKNVEPKNVFSFFSKACISGWHFWCIKENNLINTMNVHYRFKKTEKIEREQLVAHTKYFYWINLHLQRQKRHFKLRMFGSEFQFQSFKKLLLFFVESF